MRFGGKLPSIATRLLARAWLEERETLINSEIFAFQF
jgi:hypothetical protein